MAQLRHCHIDCADTGVKVAVAVPVAVVDPLGGGDAVFGAADGVGLGGEDLVDKPLQHLAHQIRRGLSEQIIGEALDGIPGENLFMATKVRYNEEPDVFKSLEGSLTRLRREHIDLLQLHGDYYTKELTDTLLQPGGMVEQMCRAKQEGLVQYLGFTGECQNAEFYRLIDTGIFDVVQVQYNVLFQHPYDPFFQSGSMYYCEEKGMGIVTMRSLTSGIFQKWMRIIQPDNTFDYSKALIQYVLSNPLVDTALLGMRSVAQVEENVAVCLDTAHRIDLAELHKRKVD